MTDRHTEKSQGCGPSGRRSRGSLPAFLAVNALGGGLLGLAFAVAIVALDLGHLRQLITFSAEGALAMGLLAMGCIVTFASVVMGSAVMLIGSDEDEPASGHRVLRDLIPVRVTVKARRVPRR
jgi:hypothetical protein